MAKRIPQVWRGLLAVLLFGACHTWLWAETEVVPVLSAVLMGGQFLFEGESSSFGGYGDLDIGPAVAFSPDTKLFAMYNGRYRGFKNVDDLVGGGTLFQQYMDHRLGVKLVHKFAENTSFKARASFKKELFRETTDEKWGKGLYDFNRPGAGIGLERRTTLGDKPFLGSVNYDFFFTHYPNYRAVQSDRGAELANVGLTAENSPGEDILNNISNQVGFEGQMAFSREWSGKASYNVILRNFTDQKLIDSTAKYLSTKRRDFIQELELSGTYQAGEWEVGGRKLKTRWSMTYGLRWNNANQNHFDVDPDPNLSKFIENFYDYFENRVGPSAFMEVDPWKLRLSLGYQLSLRNYTDRLTQASTGVYETTKLRQNTHSITFQAGYPIYPQLTLMTFFNHRIANSNTQVQVPYRYDYNSSNYFAGVGYEF